MATIKIKQQYCKGCMLCIPLCPHKSIIVSNTLNNYGIHPVVFKENGECNGCKGCALICPDMAIEIFTGNRK
ncbi:MAG: ATP-binding protein [Candidatus Brocadiales bacterium]